MEILYKEAIKKSGTSIPRSIPEQYSTVKNGGMEDGGNCLCINLEAHNKFIPYKHFKMEGLLCLK